MRKRRCSECGASLDGKAPQTRTCSDVCRTNRSRRLRAAKVKSGETRSLSPEQEAAADFATGERDDVARQVVAEELRPVVREIIDEKVMNGVRDMIGLTPAAVKAIEEDLQSDDAVIRQRAYSLVVKYTIGHSALVRPPEEEAGKMMVVNFQMPRPGDGDVVDSDAVTVDIQDDEIRQCDMCNEDKPVTEFIANSSRCRECYDKQRSAAAGMIESNAG
jgi:hypothetical protein